jgi:excisionase family DNA binding protein
MATKLSSRAPASGSPWLNVPQAAKYLGIGVDAVYAACATGGLRHSKLGHSTLRLRREWIDEWAESFARVKS